MFSGIKILNKADPWAPHQKCLDLSRDKMSRYLWTLDTTGVEILVWVTLESSLGSNQG